MPRGPRHVTRIQHETANTPIDLGLTLSVYGKDDAGKLVELGQTAPPEGAPPHLDIWPTEQ